MIVPNTTKLTAETPVVVLSLPLMHILFDWLNDKESLADLIVLECKTLILYRAGTVANPNHYALVG